MEIKKDCFGYDEQKNDCIALTELFCKKEICKFYKNKQKAIQDEIRRKSRN